VKAGFVDSPVRIDHLRGVPPSPVRALHALRDAIDPDAGRPDPPGLLIGDLVLLDMLRGITEDRAYRRVPARMRAIPPGGAETALAAADHDRALRRIGLTVRKPVDCLIAARCIAHDVPLPHADRDFDAFAQHRGLRCHP
jgi:predicted nucleic acid-binding protein